MPTFRLHAPYPPAGDQPQAIRELVEGIRRGQRFQTLLGVTGSGKTFTMAHVVAEVGLPTLVMSHNKTLAAQVYGELRQFFPENAVEYFISYYDYYQPEAYVPATDTYIEKDASINDDIDRLRLRATASLVERDDVIVVASVSAIYGLGSPRDFQKWFFQLRRGETIPRDVALANLVKILYQRNDLAFQRGTFRVRGDVVEVFPAHDETAVRWEFFGDTVERIARVDPLTGRTLAELDRCAIYPVRHFLTDEETLQGAIEAIRKEMEERLAELRSQGKLLEAQRLESRTNWDIEMMLEMGTCPGIENYSRHLSDRASGERPGCLLDYFMREEPVEPGRPDRGTRRRPWLLIIDESHVSIPQIGAMYEGDHNRKQTLVDYGFRLPSALDNRPLKFFPDLPGGEECERLAAEERAKAAALRAMNEFENLIPQCIFVSATPAGYERRMSGGVVVEQLIRPTGLVDPRVEVRPVRGQIDDLVEEIRKRVEPAEPGAGPERVLVTTLTKRMAEELSDYLADLGIRVRYMHSDIGAIERVEILRDLRLGKFDVLVGINLLREGLDLPEVGLVAILDADKEGYLRSTTALIQTIGRAARNVHGTVIMYADTVTRSMRVAIEETNRRRRKQEEYNRLHGIIPRSIVKTADQVLLTTSVADSREVPQVKESARGYAREVDREEMLKILRAEMEEAARALDFERAAVLRDQVFEIQAELEGARRGPGGRDRWSATPWRPRGPRRERTRRRR